MKAFLKTHWFHISVAVLFIIFVFFRFYQIPERNPFSWDQIDNAWAAKNILYNHHYPLLGMAAKQNTGFYIAPLYYYAIAPFYAVTNYDPIASGIFAGISSVIGFWGLYFVSMRIFDKKVTLITLLIQTVSTEAIHFDRVQWPVDFIPLFGLLGFYFLYRVLQGNSRHILTVGLILGLFLNIHFTAVLYALCVLLTIPFWPRTRTTLLYSLAGIAIVILFLVPNIIAEISTKNAHTHSMIAYLSTYSHGFHLTRLIQIAQDAVSQVNIYLPRDIRSLIGWLPVAFFLGVHITQLFHTRHSGWSRIIPHPPIQNPKSEVRNPKQIQMIKNKNSSTDLPTMKQFNNEIVVTNPSIPYALRPMLLALLVVLWYLVPWVIFTIYSGETSDYYYAINRFLSLLLIAYMFAWLLPSPRKLTINHKPLTPYSFLCALCSVLTISLLAYYTWINVYTFFKWPERSELPHLRLEVQQRVNDGGYINYTQGDPKSYLYFYYKNLKGEKAY